MYQAGPGIIMTELQPLQPITHIELNIPPAPPPAPPPVHQPPMCIIEPPKKLNGDAKKSKVKRNRKTITLDIKLEIIKRFDKGQKIAEIMRATGLGSSTISTIIANREKIVSCTFATEPNQFSSIKIVRRRSGVMENMERLITFWMEDRSQKGMPLTISAIRHKALSLFNDLKISYNITSDAEKFAGSKGWIEKFKNRHNLNNVKLSSSSSAIDVKAAEKYPDYFQSLVRDNNLSPKQVFNVDEVDLFWKRMPERTFLTQEEKGIPGYKSYKDKVTLILVTNAEGDFKIKPLLVYHSDNPRTLKRCVKSMLPVVWCSHDKGLVSSKIFEEWLTQHFFPATAAYFEKNGLENRGLLLLDYAPPHLLNFRQICGNFLVKHVPKNTTTIIQPMDQGIASTLKAFYYRKLFQQLLSESEKQNKDSVRNFWRQYNITTAVYHMADAWMDIDPAKINGSWRNIFPDCVYEQNTFDQILIQLNDIQQMIVLLAQEAGFRDILENDIIELINYQDDEMSNEILIFMDKERVEEEEERKKLQKSQLSEPILREVLKNFDKGLKILTDHDTNVDRSSLIAEKLNTALTFYRNLQKELIQSRQDSFEDSFYDSQVFTSFGDLQNSTQETKNATETSNVEMQHNEEDEIWPGEDDFHQDDYYEPPPQLTASVKDDEFDAFAKSIATQLRQLPQEVALELMDEIQQMIVKKRLEVLAADKRRKMEDTINIHGHIESGHNGYITYSNHLY